MLAPSQESRPFWSGMVYGSSRRWGRTGKLEMYQETLGHAALDCARSFMDDLGFLAAMSRGAAGTPPTAAVSPPAQPAPPTQEPRKPVNAR